MLGVKELGVRCEMLCVKCWVLGVRCSSRGNEVDTPHALPDEFGRFLHLVQGSGLKVLGLGFKV